MPTNEWDALFDAQDDEAFRSIVCKNLADGAYALHQITAQEYVARCRTEWRACHTDEVYAIKILVDQKLGATQSGAFHRLTTGMEITDLVDAPAEDPYCISIGLIHPDGSLVNAPAEYGLRQELPGRKALAFAVPSDVPADEPDVPSIGSHILCLFDVLGFSERLARDGLAAVHSLYSRLIDVALRPHVENLATPFLSPIGPGTYHPGIFWLPLRFAYFSDSILLWVPAHANCLGPFLDRCLNVVCEALKLGLPLRGAITVGDLVLHKTANVYLGEPLVEAARLEQAQDWFGVACGVSVRSEQLRLPFSPAQVMLWDVPVKPGRESLLSGLVLDWPRRWREVNSGVSAQAAVEALRTHGFDRYYDSTLDFVRHSDAHTEWFLDLEVANSPTSAANQWPSEESVWGVDLEHGWAMWTREEGRLLLSRTDGRDQTNMPCCIVVRSCIVVPWELCNTTVEIESHDRSFIWSDSQGARERRFTPTKLFAQIAQRRPKVLDEIGDKAPGQFAFTLSTTGIDLYAEAGGTKHRVREVHLVVDVQTYRDTPRLGDSDP